MTEGSVARRYARAFFEIASEEGKVDDFAQELHRILATLESAGQETQSVLSNPTFTLVERRSVLERLLPELHLHHTTRNFARLLLDKGRFDQLAGIYRAYQEMADEAANRVRVEVIASGEMSAPMRDAVSRALSASTGKHVVLNTRVDPSLLGGIIARVGSRVYDASLQTRLDNIQRALLESAQA